MSSNPSLMTRFRVWLNHDAPKDDRLRKLIEQTGSEKKLEALAAFALLFVHFLLRGHPDRVRPLQAETTDEVVRQVFTRLETQPLPAEPESVPEDVQARTAETLPAEKPSAAPPPPISEPGGMQLDIAKEFLKQMQEETSRRNTELEEEAKRLRKQGDIVFQGFITAAAVTIVIVLIGIALIFLNLVAVGIVAGAVGLLPGTGTVILNGLAKDIRSQVQRLMEQREDNLKVLQAIQATLLIPDSARRNESIVSLASKLIDRATKSV